MEPVTKHKTHINKQYPEKKTTKKALKEPKGPKAKTEEATMDRAKWGPRKQTRRPLPQGAQERNPGGDKGSSNKRHKEKTRMAFKGPRELIE